MKQGLLLTLKELIRLGIIKTKRRKKRAPYGSSRQLSTMESMGKATYPVNPQTRRTGGIVTASTPETSSQRNTDALRLRDEQAQQNVRLIESKSALENQKKLLEQQQQEQYKLSRFVDTGLQYITQDINRINIGKGYVMGYVDDDNIDIPAVQGSDSFQPQTSAKQQEEPVYTPFKDTGNEETQFAEDTSEPIGKPFDLLAQTSEGEEEENPTQIRSSSKKKQPDLRAYFSKPSDESEIETIETPQEKTKVKRRPKKKSSESFTGEEYQKAYETLINEEKAKTKAEADTGFNFPNEPVTKPEFFSPSMMIKSKGGRPTRRELDQWREWYLRLKLNDDDVLASNRREDYEKPILAKLKEQYIDIRGDDKNVLKSKDPQVVYKAIRQKSGLI